MKAVKQRSHTDKFGRNRARIDRLRVVLQARDRLHIPGRVRAWEQVGERHEH